jgi:hypothetical protein
VTAVIAWVVVHRKAIIRGVAGGLLFLAMVIPLGFLLVIGFLDEDAASSDTAGCLPGITAPNGGADAYATIGLSGDEITQARQDAAAIIAQGNADHVPPRGWTIAVAAAIQESRLLNVNYGDRDSLGLFQQRTAWGPAADRLTPRIAAHMFYTGGQGGQPGLLDIPGWQSLPLTEAAQAVQRSGFPLAYATWEQTAQSIVTSTGVDPAAACQVGAAGPWTQPLPHGSYTLSSGFGMRVHPITGVLRMHTGQDLAAPSGTPALAASAGVVIRADDRDAGGYGNLVVVQHADGVQTYYAHLSAFTVSVGAQVAEGQQVGNVGETGAATGYHLHFEVRINEVPTDPVPWMTDHGAPLGG